MEHVTNVSIMMHFSRYAALCHTQKHAYQGWNMYFLCSLAYGFYALDVQFHYCKSIISLSKFILCWDILQFSGHTYLLLKFYYEIQMLEFQFTILLTQWIKFCTYIYVISYSHYWAPCGQETFSLCVNMFWKILHTETAKSKMLVWCTGHVCFLMHMSM